MRNHPMTAFSFLNMHFESLVMLTESFDDYSEFEGFKPGQWKNPPCLVAAAIEYLLTCASDLWSSS